jgi:hypothetical protein
MPLNEIAPETSGSRLRETVAQLISQLKIALWDSRLSSASDAVIRIESDAWLAR